MLSIFIYGLPTKLARSKKEIEKEYEAIDNLILQIKESIAGIAGLNLPQTNENKPALTKIEIFFPHDMAYHYHDTNRCYAVIHYSDELKLTKSLMESIILRIKIQLQSAYKDLSKINCEFLEIKKGNIFKNSSLD